MTVEEWLDNELSIDIWNRKYRNNDESFDEWLERVSKGNENIKDRILSKKFLFGGRILANRGLGKRGYANCNSLGYVGDSLQEIMKACSDLALTYKSGAGQGVNLSHIRPKGSSISSGGTTDGVIPFLKIMDAVTGNISRGGDRRGALLAMLDAKHPDIIDFINVKKDANAVTNANLSVSVTDDFMQKVEDGDTRANEVFNEIAKAAWDNAEPGIIYFDRFRDFNLMQYVDSYQIESCNGCSEIPMPKHSSCILGNINLAEYVVNPFTDNNEFDFYNLVKDIIEIYIPAMDEIVTETTPLLPLPEQRECSEKWRPIGLGIMGLANCLSRLKIVYGSEECMDFLGVLGDNIFRAAVIGSSMLAKKLGVFPGYDPAIWESDIISEHFNSTEILQLSMNGLRNSSLLSIPPTGSTGTMLNISTGMEPFFDTSYYRRTLAGSLKKEETYYKVEIPDLIKAKEILGDEALKYFPTAHTIKWDDRIGVQSVLQESVDQALSSTINLPKETSVDEVKWLFKEAWELGCKGITIYRDQCNRKAILSSSKSQDNTFETHEAPKRPKVLPASYTEVIVKGNKYGVAIGLYNNKPYEVFVHKFDGKQGLQQSYDSYRIVKKGKRDYSLYSNDTEIMQLGKNLSESENAITILCSMLLRHGAPIKYVIKTARKVDENIVSFSSAICRVLSKYLPVETTSELCPDCGQPLINEGGCMHCNSCGYSKCMLLKELD